MNRIERFFGMSKRKQEEMSAKYPYQPLTPTKPQMSEQEKKILRFARYIRKEAPIEDFSPIVSLLKLHGRAGVSVILLLEEILGKIPEEVTVPIVTFPKLEVVKDPKILDKPFEVRNPLGAEKFTMGFAPRVPDGYLFRVLQSDPLDGTEAVLLDTDDFQAARLCATENEGSGYAEVFTEGGKNVFDTLRESLDQGSDLDLPSTDAVSPIDPSAVPPDQQEDSEERVDPAR